MIDCQDYDILITKKQTDEYSKKFGLKSSLSSLNIWGIGVGSAISGTFFGWNHGLELAGSLGFLFATLLVTVLYFILTSVFSKLAIMLPYAGGPYAYARKGLGVFEGYFTGILTVIEFAFAAAAITVTINYYVSNAYPDISINVALLCYLLFLILDIMGAKISAVVQFIITGVAISGLIIFFIGTANSVNLSSITHNNSFINGYTGVIQALPYAMWFYLCIEGVSLAAEETKNPRINIKAGFQSSIVTISILNILTLVFCISSVELSSLASTNFPLSRVLEIVQPEDEVVFSVFSAIAISNLLASLHGLVNSCSRQIFSLSRAGYLPKIFSKLHPITKTPYLAIAVTQAICILLTFTTGIKTLIFTAAIAALFMYSIVIHSYIKIKDNDHKKPDKHERKGKWYRCLYGVNVILLVSALIAIVKTGRLIFTTVFLIGIVLYYAVIGRRSIVNDAPEEVEARVDKISIR